MTEILKLTQLQPLGVPTFETLGVPTLKKKYLAKAGIFVNAKEKPTKTEPKNYNSFLNAAETHLLAEPRYTAHANF